MHHSLNHKTAIAAALLIAAGLAGAQTAPDTTPSTPGTMNSTTSPNPLQKPSSDGAPNSGTGLQTPGTGTGSSRTMRDLMPMMESAVGGAPSTTPMPATAPMPAAAMKTEPTATPAPMAHPARRDRG